MNAKTKAPRFKSEAQERKEKLSDAVRAKLAVLDLTEKDVANAVAWARTPGRKTRK